MLKNVGLIAGVLVLRLTMVQRANTTRFLCSFMVALVIGREKLDIWSKRPANETGVSQGMEEVAIG